MVMSHAHKDQWAYRLLCECLETRRQLRKLHQEYTVRIQQGEEALQAEREWVGGMIHELTEIIPMIASYCEADRLSPEERRLVERLQRAAYGKKAKTRLWDPEWFRHVPDARNWEDELIDRLDGRATDDEVLTIDLRLPRRQKQVLEAIAAGNSYGQTARLFGLTKGSVSRHLRLARKKYRGELAVQVAWKFE